jgi:mono/diheme cytochrome c family protein
MRYLAVFLLLIFAPVIAFGQDRPVRFYAPGGLIESGLPKYMLPRFSLKTQVRVTFIESRTAADLALGAKGVPLFQGLGQVWHMEVRSPKHPGTQRLAKWLQSEVGQRTVRSFAPQGEPLFRDPPAQQVVARLDPIEGDAEWGLQVSRAKCARCHVVDEASRGFGIASTPSFAVLRSLLDWEERFSAFYVLNPHPAFTQIADLTQPFPAARPSPIVPIELTLDELDALMAYVSTMPAADLGKPLQHQ